MINKKRFFFISLMFGLVWLIANQAFAIDEIYTAFLSNDAVGGYDTVAYFKQNKAVKGDSRFKVKYKGANWYFSSKENQELFQANPTRIRRMAVPHLP